MLGQKFPGSLAHQPSPTSSQWRTQHVVSWCSCPWVAQVNHPHNVSSTWGDAEALCEAVHKMAFCFTEVPAVFSHV